MSEILFRGKRIDNGEWVEGSLISGVFTTFGQDIKYILCPDKADYDCFEDFSEGNGIFEVVPDSVGQYTYLTDKNGKKIFEGDIVKDVTVPVQCGIGIVKFGKYETRIKFSLKDDNYSYHIGVYIKWNKTLNFYRHDLAFWNEKIEVIGNIHDNPEFLK